MSETTQRYWCVVPAAGSGSRMGGELPKQYQPIAGKPMLRHTLDALLSHPRIAGVVVALAVDDRHWRELGFDGDSRVKAISGGASRADSVLAGLAALAESVGDDGLVLVHDAARPCLEQHDVDRLIAAAEESGGAILAAPLGDTLKRADGRGNIAETLPRANRWRALTPQAFRRGQLTAALEAAGRDGVEVTDESMAMERAGHPVALVEGNASNIKLTTPADRSMAAFLLGQRQTEHLRRQTTMRIGQGFDVHAFGEGDHVMLGGVRIAHDKGLLAHSDGDVAIHALCDALLGAMGEGDIGKHFPPSDPRWRDADSRELLRAVIAMVGERGYALGNADLTVICEVPKLAPHVEAMRALLAADCSVGVDAISVKATTSEKLGFTGRGEGIATQAVVLLCAAR